MRFYKLNGVWQSWDYLHNELGYAEHATRPTVFKSCADATWGEDAGNGYYDGDVNDMINGTFWTDAGSGIARRIRQTQHRVYL